MSNQHESSNLQEEIPLFVLPEVLEEGDLPRSANGEGGIIAALARHLGPLPQGGPLGAFKEREVRAIVRAFLELFGARSVGGRWKVRLGQPGEALNVPSVEVTPGEVPDVNTLLSQLAGVEERIGTLERRLGEEIQAREALASEINPMDLPAPVREAVDYLNSRIEELEGRIKVSKGDSGEDTSPKRGSSRRRRGSSNTEG